MTNGFFMDDGAFGTAGGKLCLYHACGRLGAGLAAGGCPKTDQTPLPQPDGSDGPDGRVDVVARRLPPAKTAAVHLRHLDDSNVYPDAGGGGWACAHFCRGGFEIRGALGRAVRRRVEQSPRAICAMPMRSAVPPDTIALLDFPNGFLFAGAKSPSRSRRAKSKGWWGVLPFGWTLSRQRQEAFSIDRDDVCDDLPCIRRQLPA